jgi:NADH-ubiquinone oxidoreductase chain 5
MGYIFLAIGLSQYNVAVFHVVNHAFFKSMLFLAAGAIIHSMQDNQDIRKLGGLLYFLPFTYTIILIGSLSLAALPWLTGFFSKDLIIELSYAQYSLSGYFGYWLGTTTAIFTSFYSFRLISIVFLTHPNAPKNYYLHTHEPTLTIVIPLFLLSLLSIFFGYIFSDLFVGLGTDVFANSIFTHPNNITLIEAEFSLPLLSKLAPTIGTILTAIIATYLYHYTPSFLIDLKTSLIGKKLYTFFNGKYLLDIIYNTYLISGGLKTGHTISKVIDRGTFELIGPYGLSLIFHSGANLISKIDTGVITSYALYIVLSIITIIFILFTPILLSELNNTVITTNLENITIFNEIRITIIYLATLIFIFILN